MVANTPFGIGDFQYYGLAWWAGESIPGDFDGDEDVDKDDLSQWRTGFETSEADSDYDGDSDGADFLAWQRNLGTNVPSATAVPEPASWSLCCLGLPLLWLRRRAAALCAAVAVVAVTHPASAADMTLVRNSRPVTTAEAADGAPSGGMVHDLFATSSADMLSLSTYFNMAVYQHPYGSDNAAPNPGLLPYFPSLAADSFLRMPSDTLVLGGGFNGPGPEKLWGDLNNDGPQTNFLFGRLTTTQTGSFSGDFFLRGVATYVKLPFSFTLPGPSGPLSETLNLSGTEQTQSAYTPPDTSQVVVGETTVTEPAFDTQKYKPFPPEVVQSKPWLANVPMVLWQPIAPLTLGEIYQLKLAQHGLVGTAIAAVPEPSSWLMIGIAVIASSVKRGRRSRPRICLGHGQRR